MKRYFTILTMLVLAAVACKKQGPFEGLVGETLTAHIGGPQSKVAFNPTSGKFAWSDPDEIALHSTAGTYTTAQVTAAGVFTFAPQGSEVRDGYAFYPAGVADGTAAAPVVTLPASYDIDAEGMGDWYPTPMIAVNDPADDDLWFYHVGAALRLTLDNVPAGTAKLVISMGKGITGSFDVEDPATDTPTITAAETADELTFNLPSALEEDTDGIILNIPLPAGTYPKVQIVAKDGSNALIESGGSYQNWTFPRGRGRQLSYDFALQVIGSHEFSVSPARKISFAPGNLQYISGAWKFADHQYDALGEYNANAWDLFGFSLEGSSFGATIETGAFPDVPSEFVDWGNAAATFDTESDWYTLPSLGWRYLLGEFEWLRDYSGYEQVVVAPITNYGRNGGNPHALRGFATVYTSDKAIQGMVILPDEWVCPTGCKPFVGGRWEESAEAYLDNTYNAEGGTAGVSGDWARMEAAGAVFLPVAGFRDGTEVEGGLGAYWTQDTVEDSTEVLTLFFAFGYFRPDIHVSYPYGCAVRLVKDETVGSLENIIGNVGYAGEYGVGTL